MAVKTELKGKKPDAKAKRLKCLLYGRPGSGKTTFAIQMPRPYLIDTERGAENDQYVELLTKARGVSMFTNDPDELIQEVNLLLSREHPYKTVIIDPLTTIYNDLIIRATNRIAKAEGREVDDKETTAFGRHKQIPDQKIRHLTNLLTRLDMNVIITSHAKPEWKDEKPTGRDTFDCYSKLEYVFDVVIEVQDRSSGRVGIVRKSRVEGLPKGEEFPFSYDELANRYGRQVLERDCVAEVLATDDQVSEIKRLVEVLNTPDETTEKWLEKAGAANWSEMPTDSIAKCIEFLKKQIEKGAS